MATKLLSSPLYRLQDNAFFPSVTALQPIPPLLASSLASATAHGSARPSVVGLGLVKAVCAALTDGWLETCAFDPLAQRWTVRVRSRTNPLVVHVLGGDRTAWWTEQPGYLNGIAWLVDALTIGRGAQYSAEFMFRWRRLLEVFQQQVGAPPPYVGSVLIRHAQPLVSGRPSLITEGMMAVTDALYYATRARAAGADLTAIQSQPDRLPLPDEPGGAARWLYTPPPSTSSRPSTRSTGGPGASPLPASSSLPTALPTSMPAGHTRARGAPVTPGSAGATPGASSAAPPSRPAGAPGVAPAELPAAGESRSSGGTGDRGGDRWGLPADVDPLTHLGVVCRVVATGRSALLVGPTGAGKTSLVLQAARVLDAEVVLLEGWPSLTDREFYGKIEQTLTDSGQPLFIWKDGPLAQAWRVAMRGQRVTLVLDELARLDPLYVAPLISALNQLQGRDVARLVGLDPALRATLHPTGWYRFLRLPTGEQLLAPVERLSVLATANLGLDYLSQAHTEFDPALLGRFDVHLDLVRLDTATRCRLLVEAGAPMGVALVLAAAEEFTTQQTGHVGGLLRRELNLRVCKQWAQEARDRRVVGVAWPEAILRAADLTAIPFCCARDTAGALDAPAAEAFRDWLRGCLTAARLPAA